MDGEEHGNAGLNGYAWFELGRTSAEGERQTSELLQSLRGRTPVPVDTYNRAVLIAEDWRAECHRLQQINAQLQAELNAANAFQVELKAWAEKMLIDRDRWKTKTEEKGRQTYAMSQLVHRLRDELEELKGNA